MNSGVLSWEDLAVCGISILASGASSVPLRVPGVRAFELLLREYVAWSHADDAYEACGLETDHCRVDRQS